jgi:hypothetical protein
MNTLEIELHEATISNSVVTVAYTLYDGQSQADVNKHQINKKELVKFILENELNIYCSDVILGEYNQMYAETYLDENLNDVVLAYLTANLS